MKVLLATPGRFHSFALARELQSRAALDHIVTGFPWFKVARENLPRRQVRTAPVPQMLSFALKKAGLIHPQLDQRLLLETLCQVDGLALKSAGDADLFVALSGCGQQTGTRFRKLGLTYVCDRGSSHILYQQKLLNEEADRHGAPRPFFNAAVVRRELCEYDTADAITVPSQFAEQSFLAYGIAQHRLHRVPYGVNLTRFYPTTAPASDRFEVLFVGSLTLRKGVPYLLKAFRDLAHPRKRLTLVGPRTSDTAHFSQLLQHDDIRVMGAVANQDLKHIMSASHVMVMPSIEEGLALVQAEALACGCPVIGTDHSGAADLFDNDREGFIVPIRSDRAIREKLEFLADNPDRRQQMSEAARARVATIGGWSRYGEQYFGLLQALVRQT